MTSAQNRIKMKSNNKKIPEKYPNIWQLNTLLNNSWAKKKSQRKKTQYRRSWLRTGSSMHRFQLA